MGVGGIPELISERLVLRPHDEADFDAAVAMWGDPDVVRFIGGRPFTRDEVWHRILRYLGHWSLKPFGYWAIHDRSNDRFVGEIGLADWKRSNVELDAPEAGWVLIPQVHGRGYAKEAIGTMLQWADAHSLETTCCIIDERNRASIVLAERFGYVLTGGGGSDVKVYRRVGIPDAEAS